MYEQLISPYIHANLIIEQDSKMHTNTHAHTKHTLSYPPFLRCLVMGHMTFQKGRQKGWIITLHTIVHLVY